MITREQRDIVIRKIPNLVSRNVPPRICWSNDSEEKKKKYKHVSGGRRVKKKRGRAREARARERASILRGGWWQQVRLRVASAVLDVTFLVFATWRGSYHAVRLVVLPICQNEKRGEEERKKRRKSEEEEEERGREGKHQFSWTNTNLFPLLPFPLLSSLPHLLFSSSTVISSNRVRSCASCVCTSSFSSRNSTRSSLNASTTTGRSSV